MAHALRLGLRGLGRTWPNPAVGCVLLRDGRVVGRGWTQPGGRPHAERMALAAAGTLARGATAYVTLEPCAHHAKTPPCAEALVAAGVRRVVSALTDPDPRVAGRGHAILRAAGIEVTEGVLSAQAARANAGFLRRVVEGLPFVTLKLATTLDGRIATASGDSRWITGAQARRHVHLLRMTHDAVMVGSGTALADDPDLSVRDLGSPHQPVRVVLDSRLSHSPDSRLGRSTQRGPVWMVHGPDAPASAQAGWLAAGAEVIEVAAEGGHLSMRAAMQALAARGLTRVFCEGGGTLAAALVRDRLASDLAVYQAGALIGAEGRASFGPLGLDLLAGAPRLALREQALLGPDTFTLWSF
ncbi:MAG: bifunctional diaminohydroxyphosphoribosylaminopyrimidine deaminase/5-amino-6-(5-phosphoribosylamino)uracil reductase RibD [Paracoccaceae bacterium]